MCTVNCPSSSYSSFWDHFIVANTSEPPLACYTKQERLKINLIVHWFIDKIKKIEEWQNKYCAQYNKSNFIIKAFISWLDNQILFVPKY